MKYLIRFRIVLISLTVLIAGFGLVGALWLPGYIKTQTEQALSQTLGRTVTIGKIEISPYILQLRLHDFQIAHPKTSKPGQSAEHTPRQSTNPVIAQNRVKTATEINSPGHLLSIKTITANLSSLSIIHRAPVLQELIIDRPEIQLARDAKGRLSVADILETLAKAPKPDKPLRFAVHNIQLIQGSIDFQDKAKQKTHTVRDLAIDVPVVINFPAKEEIWIEPRISAKVNGAGFDLKGKTHVFGNKKEAVLDLNMQDFPLAGLETYADTIPGLKITSGAVSTKLALSFVQEHGKAAATALKGDLQFANLSASHKPPDSHLHSMIEEIHVSLQGLQIALPDVMAKSRVESLELASGANGRIVLADPTLKGVNPFIANKISIKVNPVELSGASSAAIELAAQINQRGKATVKGNVSGWLNPATLAGNLDIQARQVDVIAFQRFLTGFLHNALFTRGQASFEGNVLIGAEPGGKAGEKRIHADKLKARGLDNGLPAIRVRGNASLNDFSLLDQTNSAEIARWKQIQLGGLNITTSPFTASVRDISANSLFGRVTLLPSGELNFRQILDTQGASGPVAGSSTPTTVTGAASGALSPAPNVSDTRAKTPSNPKADLPIEIGQIRLTDSSVQFHDQFTKPNFRASLTNLSGTLGPLKAGAPGNIAITGTVDRAAPLSIQGQLDPFAKDLFLDLKVIARGIEMPPMSAYSIKYLAYPIEKGKLSVDLNYAVNQGQLKAENKIFLDQLTLGERVDSPDAISAPVSLAIALLKNTRGEIDINLPISGSINDPEFKIGSIIFKAFLNLIAKAATAPFSLIASLFGGGADISHIDFPSGVASMDANAVKTVESIAKAMNERPGLKLEITATANAAKDTAGAKNAILQRQVRAEKLADLAKKGESAARLREIEVTTEEYPKYLTMVYKKAPFKKERNLLLMTKTIPVPEMESLLREHIDVGNAELLTLADQRSRAVRNQLVKQGVAAERVFVMASKLGESGQAKFSLR